MTIKSRLITTFIILINLQICFPSKAGTPVSLIDRIIVPNACFAVNLNIAKLQSSEIYKYWMQKSGDNKTPDYIKLVNTLNKYGYKPEDLQLVSITGGAPEKSKISIDNIQTDKFYFSVAAKLSKAVDTNTLYAILNEQIPPDEKNVQVTKIKYNNTDVIKIHSDRDLYFSAIPAEELVVGGDYESLTSILDGKHNPSMKIPEELIRTIPFSSSDDCYAVIVIPDSVSTELSASKNIQQPLHKNSLFNIDTDAFKDIKALVLKIDAADSVSAKANAYFTTAKSASSVSQMIKTLLPLAKFQLMLKANGRPLPFINNFDGGILGQNIVTLYATLVKEDIDTLTAPSKPSTYNIGGKQINI